MGFQTSVTLKCDRCGAEVPASDKVIASIEFREKFPGWRMVGDERTLCPECAPGYELLIDKQAIELEDYVTGKKK